MKKFLAVAFAAVATVWAQSPIEIIGHSNTWWTAQGEATSTATIEGGNGNHSPLKGTIVLGSATNPWAGISTALGSDNKTSLLGLTSIDVTYSATATFRIGLTTDIGSDDGTGFRTEIDAASSEVTVNIPIDDFKRPDWAGVEQIDVKTKLGDATGFDLTIPNGTGGSFTVSSFRLNFGSGGGVQPTFTVTFNAGTGASVSPQSIPNVQTGQQITLPTPTRTGYTFNGWFTAATGGTKISDAGSYNVTQTAAITMYAQWTATGGGDPQMPTGDHIELIGRTGLTWGSYKDEASTVTIRTESPLDATLSLSNTQTSYLALATWSVMNLNFAGLTDVVITYTADKDFSVSLEIGQNLSTAQLTAGTNVTRVLPLSQFSPQPNLAAVSGVLFAHTHSGQSLDLKVTSLKLFGLSEGSGGGGQNPHPGETLELIGWEYTSWTHYSSQTSNVTFSEEQDGRLIAELSLGQSSGYWPYLGLSTWPQDITRTAEVKITYISDGIFSLGIGLKGTGALDGDGNPASVDYIVPLNKSSTPETVILPLKLFRAPAHPIAGFTGPANLCLADREEFAGLTFAHTNYGQTVNLQVLSLELRFGDVTGDCTTDSGGGGGGGVGVSGGINAARSRLAITGISAGRLGLSVPMAGLYTVSIHSPDGRMLAHTEANLVQGVNSLVVGRNFARGVAIVRIQGANSVLVRRVSIK